MRMSSGGWHGGKGSGRRKVDQKRFDNNYDEIFKKDKPLSTITEEYRQVLKETHARAGTKKWGNTGHSIFFKHILDLVERKECTEFLDYGAGWGGVKAKIKEERPDWTVHEFEPAREDVCAPAEPRDFVVCTDVFEHVEPECLEDFFLDLQRVTNKWGYFTVCMTPAVRILSDGRNAHLIQKPFEWWLIEVGKYFDIRQARHMDRYSPHGDFLVEKKAPLPDYHKI